MNKTDNARNNASHQQTEVRMAKVWNFSNMNGFEFLLEASAEYMLTQRDYRELPCPIGNIRSFVSRGSVKTSGDKYAVLISHPEHDYLILLRCFGDYEVFMRSWSCLASVIGEYLAN